MNCRGLSKQMGTEERSIPKGSAELSGARAGVLGAKNALCSRFLRGGDANPHDSHVPEKHERRTDHKCGTSPGKLAPGMDTRRSVTNRMHRFRACHRHVSRARTDCRREQAAAAARCEFFANLTDACKSGRCSSRCEASKHLRADPSRHSGITSAPLARRVYRVCTRDLVDPRQIQLCAALHT